MNRSAAMLAAWLLSLPANGQLTAQTIVPDEPLCPRCAIAMRTIVMIGATDGPGAMAGRPMSVNIDARGRWWLFQELEPPTVFAPSGAVLQVVGRKGSGPGEFRSANYGLAIGDSMLVFDWLESRATMIGPDLTAGRIVRNPYPHGYGLLVAWPGTVALAGNQPQSSPPNRTIHLLSFADGEPRLARSFGPAGTGGPMGNVEVQQKLGAGRGGRFWSTYWNRAEFMRWSATGTRDLWLRRRYDWYTGETPASIGRPGTPPTPMTAAIQEDDEGLVWLFIHTPAPTWADAWPANADRTPEVRMRDMDYDALFDTYVEVIDPVRARVVARQKIDGYLLQTLPGGRAAFYRIDAMGMPRVQIVELALTGR